MRAELQRTTKPSSFQAIHVSTFDIELDKALVGLMTKPFAMQADMAPPNDSFPVRNAYCLCLPQSRLWRPTSERWRGSAAEGFMGSSVSQKEGRGMELPRTSSFSSHPWQCYSKE